MIIQIVNIGLGGERIVIAAITNALHTTRKEEEGKGEEPVQSLGPDLGQGQDQGLDLGLLIDLGGERLEPDLDPGLHRPDIATFTGGTQNEEDQIPDQDQILLCTKIEEGGIIVDQNQSQGRDQDRDQCRDQDQDQNRNQGCH